MGQDADITGKPIPIDVKVEALRQPAIYPHCPDRIEVKETHMSWVFLAGNLVFKLKKPIRSDFLNFSTLAARRWDSEREVRLNRRLAGDVYLGTVALKRRPDGGLALQGDGTVVDWLVQMRRLPAGRMLDAAIERGTVTEPELARFCRRMTAFYQFTAEPVATAPAGHLRRFAEDVRANADELGKAAFALPAPLREPPFAAQRAFLAERGGLLEQRARDGRIVEAHGDLRLEHVCLLETPVVIDCLEFNRGLRILDPVDELAYLGLECERLGAPEIGAQVLRQYCEATGDRVPGELVDFYKAFRACVRAKIALWHTEDDAVHDHDKWRGRARDYLEIAARHIG